ncbi:hypothetical protein [Mycobacterium sp. 1245805.9]|nr:hypothetical protein [Mycobacterium sp. 1245805.9]
MWFAITVIAVLMVAGYVVHRTGSTRGLVDIGKMVAEIIRAFMA